jgi:hypothetical protein
MKPIIIIGAPRSGTMLVARLIGGHPSACLITEHIAKVSEVPEDRAGVLDEHLWRYSFQYEANSDVPICDSRSVTAIRDIYTAIARDRLLVLKNPRHSLRVPVLREIFPDARFVFVVRNPWHVMQSATSARNPNGFLLRSERINALPNDPLVRAAATWAECAAVYAREHDQSWTLVRYEEIISKPTTLNQLLAKLGLDDAAYVDAATTIVRQATANFHFLKQLYRKSRFKPQIRSLIRDGVTTFGYAESPDTLPSSLVDHHARRLKLQLHETVRTLRPRRIRTR